MDLPAAYQNNPFCVLGASARNTREELMNKQEELALFGDSARSEPALSALLNPQMRLEAEMRWFPLMDETEIRSLLAFFSRHMEDTEMPETAVPSFLGQFNMLRLALSRLPFRTVGQVLAILRSLAVAADPLLPRQVRDEINEDRRAAGFPEIQDSAALDTRIADLLDETVRDFLDRMAARIVPADFRDAAKQCRTMYKDTKSPYHNSYLLELAANRLDTGGSGT